MTLTGRRHGRIGIATFGTQAPGWTLEPAGERRGTAIRPESRPPRSLDPTRAGVKARSTLMSTVIRPPRRPTGSRSRAAPIGSVIPRTGALSATGPLQAHLRQPGLQVGKLPPDLVKLPGFRR